MELKYLSILPVKIFPEAEKRTFIPERAFAEQPVFSAKYKKTYSILFAAKTMAALLTTAAHVNRFFWQNP